MHENYSTKDLMVTKMIKKSFVGKLKMADTFYNILIKNGFGDLEVGCIPHFEDCLFHWLIIKTYNNEPSTNP